ncbi:MAG TPA: outer membrane lipoprotein chaperone LolA [Longimicrobiaceae bacterium]|jgi:outer membrane lipoprotein carrier protein|nr:outer membrane lipoprotein chaperone LolA [Longimicrobiaceae bacterium]
MMMHAVLALALAACSRPETPSPQRQAQSAPRADSVTLMNGRRMPINPDSLHATDIGGMAAADIPKLRVNDPAAAAEADTRARAAAEAPVSPTGDAVRSGEAAPGEASRILNRVAQVAAGIRSMEADFTQTLTVPLINQTQRSTGKLYQRRPDRFAMRFTNPAGDLMVADGRHFWIYTPSTDRHQVIRASAGSAGQADFQQQFLSNPNSRYVATLNGSDVVGGRAVWALTLVPKRASQYKVLRIWVDKADYMVRRFEMTEENESVRRVELRNVRINAPIAESVFAFTPPAGTQVFDQ